MVSRLRAHLLIGAGTALAGALLLCDRSAPASGVANALGRAEFPDLPALIRAAGDAVAHPATVGDEPSRASSAVVDLAQIQLVGDRYQARLTDGRTAVLTLDPTLQAAAEAVLERAKAPRGAVVVTDLDGRVLALAGRRTDDPNGGSDGSADPRLALDAWAPAASIFKVVSTAAMVEAGARGDERVCYHGGVRSVMASNLEDSRNDRRCDNLRYGLAHSQNAIIAKLAHRYLDPQRLAEMARRFGFDQPLAFAAPASYGTAVIPTAKGVEFAKTAAGFSGVQLSALGGAILAGTIARGGEAPPPTLIAAILDDGREISPVAATATPVLEPRVAAEVAAMMTETCTKGSAAKAFRGRQQIPNTSVAGKTGTLSQTEPFYTQYSWFVGYAPTEKPALAVSVVLGNAELWHLKAHSAARAVLAAGLGQAPARTGRMARR